MAARRFDCREPARKCLGLAAASLEEVRRGQRAANPAAPGYGSIVIRSCTSVTPGADQAARSAMSRSYQA
jgi:hypothetical protein